MNTQPGMEARLSAQERRQIHTDARIEEIATEMSASFKQLGVYLDTNMATKEDIARIEATMATKEDLTKIEINMISMETRILDAFKQMLAMVVNPQHPHNE